MYIFNTLTLVCQFIVALKICHDSFLFVFFFRAALAEWVEEDLGETEVIRCGSVDMTNLMMQFNAM